MVWTPEELKAGNGIFMMKNKNEYLTLFFPLEMIVVTDGKEIEVHASTITGESDAMNMAKDTIGTIEGGTYFDGNGETMTPKKMSKIYMIVKWWDTDKKDFVQERIDLYHKEGKTASFYH